MALQWGGPPLINYQRIISSAPIKFGSRETIDTERGYRQIGAGRAGRPR